MFTRDGSILLKNETKPFYWLEMTLVQKLTNRIASFRFRLNMLLDRRTDIILSTEIQSHEIFLLFVKLILHKNSYSYSMISFFSQKEMS